ncbi:MAG: beta-phosphoglucomutase family hydrolase [Propionibacteriaceae bacterium]
MNWDDYDAALFDLDGVLTPTADVHMLAWEKMFSEFLTARGVEEPYTEADYFDYVDGKPRYDGVRSFLMSRDIELPDGHPDDDPSVETVCGLGNRKNDAFSAVLREDGVEAYPGSVALLDHLADLDVKIAVVSSSKNAPAVLTAAGLRDRFTVIVDGNVAAARGLLGKPSPETFADAAQQLGCTVERSVVLEDALSGVAAGHAGGFGLVVGVDRGVGADRLRQAGADIVVDDLDQLIDDEDSDEVAQ